MKTNVTLTLLLHNHNHNHSGNGIGIDIIAKSKSFSFFKKNFKFIDLKSSKLSNTSLYKSRSNFLKNNFLRKLTIEGVITPTLFTHIQPDYRLHSSSTQYAFSLKAFGKLWKILFFEMIHKSIDYRLLLFKYFGEEIYNNNRVYEMVLNFKRNRFFPYFRMRIPKDCIFNLSLGILSKNFSSRKSFLRSKSSYLMSASYVRRMLIYIQPARLNLNIRRVPKYFKDILSVIMEKSNVLYKHPLKSELVNEKEFTPENAINFEYINFITCKALGPVKKKKRGRLKRKISKKVILYNNIID